MPKIKKAPTKESFTISKNLTRDEAIKKAPKPKYDRRGFNYDPKTGKGSWI